MSERAFCYIALTASFVKTEADVCFSTAHEIPLAIDQFFLFVEYMFYFYDTSGSLNSEYDSKLSVSVTRET